MSSHLLHLVEPKRLSTIWWTIPTRVCKNACTRVLDSARNDSSGSALNHASEVSRCFDLPRRNRHCLPFNAMTSEATKQIFCRQGLRMSVVGHLSSRLNDRSRPESLRSPLGWQLNSTALCEYQASHRRISVHRSTSSHDGRSLSTYP